MATTTNPSASQRRKNTTIPPRRGQVKTRIFEGLAKTIVSVASKAGGAMGRNGGDNGGDGRSSASATPPASAYHSDGN